MQGEHFSLFAKPERTPLLRGYAHGVRLNPHLSDNILPVIVSPRNRRLINKNDSKFEVHVRCVALVLNIRKNTFAQNYLYL